MLKKSNNEAQFISSWELCSPNNLQLGKPACSPKFFHENQARPADHDRKSMIKLKPRTSSFFLSHWPERTKQMEPILRAKVKIFFSKGKIEKETFK